jgi:RNA polymerase sigma-70 factor (ECF subfamily)
MGWFSRVSGHASEITDEEAMGRVRTSGDSEAFALLVNRWETPIRRLCVRMTGDLHRGEDLSQETFARVFASRASYDASHRFSTWLWRIAINLCYENGRRLKLTEPIDVQHLADGGSDPHDHVVAAERAACVRSALGRLSDAQRAVVVLREYENLKFREIADVLDLPEGTVKWHMGQAMQQLARDLKATFDDEAQPKPTTLRVAL